MTPTYGMLSTYPPTQCGLATFTAALAHQLAGPGEARQGRCGVVRAVDDLDTGPTVGVVHELRRGSLESQRRAVRVLDEFDVVIVQHEYGIYGGPDGDEIIGLLRELTVPVIAVLHTVLVEPTLHQRQVLEAVVEEADAVVTMTRTALRWLREHYDVDMTKASVIPHGAAVSPPVAAAAEPATRPTILTWGLLGPGKGIEWGLEALALLGDVEPAPRYLIVGETHPRVREREGEAYREGLERKVRTLGLTGRVDFDASYLDLASLARIVSAADVVLLPYDSPNQVTSGVLIEAVAAGKPVVSSRFPHAIELLGGGVGLLVPHRDPVAIAAALRRVLTDPHLEAAMVAGARRLAPDLGWPAVAGRYRELATELLASRSAAVA